MKKIIFLDFNGVMDTEYYDHYLIHFLMVNTYHDLDENTAEKAIAILNLRVNDN